MITNIDNKTNISELNRKKLPTYWNEYFEYETDVELSSLTKIELVKEINDEREKSKPFINSQIIISKILTKLGAKHNFHRQFNERHAYSNSAQILGMQLYHIIVEDEEKWTYCELKEVGHLFPHATYFK
jgi:hypothetical protein